MCHSMTHKGIWRRKRGRREGERNREKEIFYLLVHSSNDHIIQSRIGQSQESGTPVQLASIQANGPLSVVSQVHEQEGRSQT